MPLETTPRSVAPAQSSEKSRFNRRSAKRWSLIIALGLVFVLGIVALAVEFGWWGLLVGFLEKADPVLTIVLMALLPIAGFSIGVVYVAAGLKFGLWGGGLVIVGVTTVHLLVTHWLARTFLQRPIRRFLEKRNYRLPEAPHGAELSLAAMVALVPGPPYFLRNYALALSGMPLKKYFFVCLGVYTVRSYVTLALGDLGGDPSRSGFFWLGAIVAVKLTICAFLIRRIQKTHREMREAGKPNAKLTGDPDAAGLRSSRGLPADGRDGV